jgi:uncharacterized protein YabN with tetrapyrrole methylase and pyrophosphatase domain
MNKLFVVGSGIKSISHISQETKVIIQQSDKVLYLLNEDSLKEWVKRESKASQSLEPIYFSSSKRIDAYQNITNYIIEQHSKYKSLCVIFYGHPTVYAQSALSAVKEIREKDGEAYILPAISFLDCLFSDLEIDPGEHGCFTIDATELLIYERVLDKYSHVIISQISSLGQHDVELTSKIEILYNYLKDFYEDDTQICLYEAAQLPTIKPVIKWITLHELIDCQLNQKITLYIPPVAKANISKRFLKELKININNYQITK